MPKRSPALLFAGASWPPNQLLRINPGGRSSAVVQRQRGAERPSGRSFNFLEGIVLPSAEDRHEVAVPEPFQKDRPSRSKSQTFSRNDRSRRRRVADRRACIVL